MKKVIKSVLLGILGLSMCCFANVKAEAVSTDGLVTAEINVSKEEVMSNVRVIASGEVIGNGVRLREKPSTSATVLELMYDGESVTVNSTKTVTKNGIRWYYVKRTRTGTWGYADSDYIVY